MEENTNNTVISNNFSLCGLQKIKIMENVFGTLATVFAPQGVQVEKVEVEFADDDLTLEEFDERLFSYTNNDLYVSFGDFGAIFDVDATLSDSTVFSSIYNDPREVDLSYKFDIKLLRVIDENEVDIEVSQELWDEIEETGYDYITDKLQNP